MEGRSKLYSRAKKNNLERPKIQNHIIKNDKGAIQYNIKVNNNNQDLLLPIIKTQYNKPNITPKSNITNVINKYPPKKNPFQFQPYKRNSKYKSYKSYMKDNLLYSIISFLDIQSLANFMLTCRQFYRVGNSSDEIWFGFYQKRFKDSNNKNTNYESHRGNWKKFFTSTCAGIHHKNYDALKKKYLTKYKKNIYNAKKDHYFISNNLFSHLKPLYFIQINNNVYPIKYILSNKILSHINWYSNFDQEYQDMNKIKIIKLLLTEKNLGFFRVPIIEYNIKQIKFDCTEDDGLISKICKVYYNNELIISTFEKNFIFFINLSLPLCKVCERLFDFLNGIHGKNLNYACDSDSKFGLYDYSLLINLKSWNKIYYSLSCTTCDFKEDVNFAPYELYYINSSVVPTSFKIKFDIKTICMKDYIENFLIFDIVLLSYDGDHVLCDSKPIVLKEDTERVDYDEYGCSHYIAKVIDDRYIVEFKFNFSAEKNYYALVSTELRMNKKFVEKIFVRN